MTYNTYYIGKYGWERDMADLDNSGSVWLNQRLGSYERAVTDMRDYVRRGYQSIMRYY